jgi:hypothetical protein
MGFWGLWASKDILIEDTNWNVTYKCTKQDFLAAPNPHSRMKCCCNWVGGMIEKRRGWGGIPGSQVIYDQGARAQSSQFKTSASSKRMTFHSAITVTEVVLRVSSVIHMHSSNLI